MTPEVFKAMSAMSTEDLEAHYRRAVLNAIEEFEAGEHGPDTVVFRFFHGEMRRTLPGGVPSTASRDIAAWREMYRGLRANFTWTEERTRSMQDMLATAVMHARYLELDGPNFALLVNTVAVWGWLLSMSSVTTTPSRLEGLGYLLSVLLTASVGAAKAAAAGAAASGAAAVGAATGVGSGGITTGGATGATGA